MRKKVIFVLSVIIMFSCGSTSTTTSSKKNLTEKEKIQLYNKYFAEANDYYKQRNWRKAANRWKKAAAHHETFGVYYNTGLAAYNRERYKDAIKYFEKSLRFKHSQNDELNTNKMLDNCRVAYEIQKEERRKLGAAILGAVIVTAAGVATEVAMQKAGVPLNDPQYQRYLNYRNSGLPGALTLSYEDYKKYEARAISRGNSIDGNSSSSGSSNNTSSGSSSSSSVASSSKRKCGFCGGRGWNVEYTAGFGLAKPEYCSQCGKEMMSNHYHATCQHCKGTGYEQ